MAGVRARAQKSPMIAVIDDGRVILPYILHAAIFEWPWCAYRDPSHGRGTRHKLHSTAAYWPLFCINRYLSEDQESSCIEVNTSARRTLCTFEPTVLVGQQSWTAVLDRSELRNKILGFKWKGHLDS